MVRQNNLLILILTVGVFGILTTEMGIVGILPVVAERFDISVTEAGLLVSLFALAVAISGPILPLLFSGINRKKVMLLVLGIFVAGNIVSLLTSSFTILLIARIVPAFFHPIYCALALTVAATSVSKEEAPKAVSKVILGVNAGMILGVPITTYIASVTSVEMAMLFFAIVNALALIATLVFIPSMPVKERLTYGTQIGVLKKPIMWVAIATVVFIGSANSSINSFIAEYLGAVTHISGTTLTFALFIFGIASLVGNFAGGRFLTKNAMRTATFFPIVLGLFLMLSFLTGKSVVPMLITLLFWGILFAIGNNVSQYWISSSAQEAPDFANGMFLSCSNLGVTIGTSVGGLFISGMGAQYIVIAGVLFLIMSLASILLRKYMFNPSTQQKAAGSRR
ncbi:MFS transporter [Paenibacillus durus]|uniref:Arabinose ABC transporter permease n=1 Tax=Paenibacillus durus ATCC 35681 TaxID=1333534 RepID=A0A0F7F912_PAEDU|nr:MFS transporter [Paenibacillus durus]AKG34807.1 arabinose ABC transporter permease [Paenibacillus durus ATCC 35681]